MLTAAQYLRRKLQLEINAPMSCSDPQSEILYLQYLNTLIEHLITSIDCPTMMVDQIGPDLKLSYDAYMQQRRNLPSFVTTPPRGGQNNDSAHTA